ALAVVQCDGGRLQILDRPTAAAAAPTAGAPAAPVSHWREDKVGLLATMTSTAGTADPCPDLPAHFVDPLRILKLAREIKGSVGVTEAEVTAPPVPAEAAAAG